MGTHQLERQRSRPVVRTRKERKLARDAHALESVKVGTYQWMEKEPMRGTHFLGRSGVGTGQYIKRK